MVRPTRIYRPRELLSVESVVGDVSGTDVDWGTSPIGIPASSGRDQWKQPVRVASTASVTVSTALNNGDTIDGVTLATGDRVLLKDQSTGSQNGIYIVGATPIRAADMDDDDEVLGALVYVIAGTTNTATAWKVTNTSAVTVGSTSIVWAAFGTGGSASFATPAIVLGTAAAAGAASTVIRSDATIVAFDATSPADVASSAATGSAAFAPHRDHAHRGVKSLSKSGSAALYGDVTLTGGSNVTLTQSGNDISIASTGGGASQAFNESDAAVLVNATSTGDAGSRADHFPGTSLDVAWVGEATALGQGPTVKYSAVGMRMTANNAHHRLRAYTPSGAFRVEGALKLVYKTASGGSGLFVRDSGTGDASGNGMLVWIGSTGRGEAYSLDTGTYTSRGTTTVEDSGYGNGKVYLAIERDGSNNWTLQISTDRAMWITILSGHAKTFTVAKIGYRVFGVNAELSSDFFDVVS